MGGIVGEPGRVVHGVAAVRRAGTGINDDRVQVGWINHPVERQLIPVRGYNEFNSFTKDLKEGPRESHGSIRPLCFFKPEINGTDRSGATGIPARLSSRGIGSSPPPF
jgi:hypothetical protein